MGDGDGWRPTIVTALFFAVLAFTWWVIVASCMGGASR